MYLARLHRHPSRRKRAGEGEEKSSSSKGRRRKRTVGVCSTWMAEAVRRLVGRGDRQDSALSLPLCRSLFPLPSLAFHSAACACVPLRSAPARFEYRQGGRGDLTHRSERAAHRGFPLSNMQPARRHAVSYSCYWHSETQGDRERGAGRQGWRHSSAAQTRRAQW